MAGCKIFAPFGETSVIKTAAPIAKGVAMRADKIVTIKEPKIIEGHQIVSLKDSKFVQKEIKDVDPIDKEGR